MNLNHFKPDAQKSAAAASKTGADDSEWQKFQAAASCRRQ